MLRVLQDSQWVHDRMPEVMLVALGRHAQMTHIKSRGSVSVWKVAMASISIMFIIIVFLLYASTSANRVPLNILWHRSMCYTIYNIVEHFVDTNM